MSGWGRNQDSADGWRRGKDQRRGRRGGKSNDWGRDEPSYIKGLMETRGRIENMEYMDQASMNGHKHYRRRGKGRGFGSKSRDRNGEEREKPPPGLKGRALGLWFRDRSKANKKNKENEPEPIIEFTLDEDKENTIRRLVDSISTPMRVPIQTHIPERVVRKRSRSQSPENRSQFMITLLSSLLGFGMTMVHYFLDSLFRPVKKEPLEFEIKQENFQVKQEPIDIKIKYDHMEESPFKRIFLSSITGHMMDNVDNALQMKSRLERDPELDKELLEDLREKQKSSQYREMQGFRRKLPSWDKREELLRVIDNNQVIVISGETGCGKTTQVGQFILDQEIERGSGSTCHVICTQPRRISAISVADRVAAERNETVGIGGGSVGYTIRLESSAPRDRGSIHFCTTGILLRMLETDPALTRVSHLILDEIHERDTISDFAITILKDIMPKRPDLKLILMSATLNAEDFSKYYNDCAMINIPGFTFPVTEHYLEDVLQLTRYIPSPMRGRGRGRGRGGGGGGGGHKFKGSAMTEDVMAFRGMVHPYLREITATKKYSKDVINYLYDPESEEISLELIVELITHIDQTQGEGAVLVFLPGWDKISALNRLLTESGFTQRSGYRVIPLHSMLSTVSQRTIFDRPPQGVRKIVIATNIAETSITIDDVVFVIDCGKIKMKNFDLQLNITTLKEEWESLANARQRRGRAGRVRDGVCYHLFTRAREMMLESYPLPEMMRTRLEEVILQAKMLQLGNIKPFLSRVLNPPDPKAIELSLKLLCDLNALDNDEHLTPLGYHLARLPMDPQTGKMILMGALFRVIDPVFSVAASLSFKDAFAVPMEEEKEFFKKKKELAMGTKSDHLVLAEALTRWEAENETRDGWRFTREYFLSTSTLTLLKDMKKQFANHLHEMKFLATDNVKDPKSNRNSANIGLIKAIICAGLYPNVAIIKNVRKIKTGRVVQKIVTPEDGPVNLHIRSINYDEDFFEGRFLVYHLKMKTSKVYLYDTTMVYALALIFFGHNFELFKENKMVIIELSPKIRFTCAASTALLVKELRQRLDELLEKKVAHPGITDWDPRFDEGKLLSAITELISHEDQKLSMVDYSDEEYEDDEAEETDTFGSGREGYTSNSDWRSNRNGEPQPGPSGSGVTPFPPIWN